MIVFYEKEYAESLLKNKNNKLSRRNLNYLAKYWDSLGHSESEIENNLLEFCLKNDEHFNAIQNYAFYHRATVHARNNKLRIPTPIKITRSEIESIQRIPDVFDVSSYKIQKFIFIMLVVAKFFKYHQSRKNVKESPYDQYLYSNTSPKEIAELAGVSFTKAQWKEIKYVLTTINLINPTIVGAQKWVIGFWNEVSPAEIWVEDYRNPITYYQEYSGENLISCLGCGVKISRKSNRHSYCKSCWTEHRLAWDRERKRKISKKIPLLENRE